MSTEQESLHSGSSSDAFKVDVGMSELPAQELDGDKQEGKNESPSNPVRSKVNLLSDSDLVWAKVRSHPWWPGQVFNASAATDKAKKHFKKGTFLVTYFGDCSFAWNDASKLKPFRHHFSQLSKQSSLPDFLDAVEFALEEVSRRVEFGLACPCLPEEVYERIKTQKIINPGVREDASKVHGGDKVSSAVFFEPSSLVDYVKGLACSHDASDEVEFVSQRGRLLAFSRWKGYTDLPELETLQGSVESAPKILCPAEVKESEPEPEKSKQVYTKRRKTEDKEGVFEYEDTTTVHPKKKEKTLAEFIAEKRLSKSNGNVKVVHSAKRMKTKLRREDSGSPVSPKNDLKIIPKKAKTSFGIGASILRVANQMHCSTPTGLVPCGKKDGGGKSRSKLEAVSEREPVRGHSASATKASTTGKANPISRDKLQSGEVEHVVKETPSTDLLDDESRDLKGSSSEEKMVSEDRKEAGNITTKDSNLTEEKTKPQGQS